MAVKTNEAAVDALEKRGWMPSTVEKMVEDLVAAGVIEADPDPRTPAEQLADVARRWMGAIDGKGPGHVFDCASGWSTAGWQYVIDDNGLDIKLNFPETRKYVFDALVILAKDAGKSL